MDTTLSPKSVSASAERRPSLLTMRLIATGLLVLMAALFLIAASHQGVSLAWGYARAFAEAALVGGLADWFAVTALFRRPLGLPIPHTAVIPNSKARIADAMGEFVAVNFLSPQVISSHLADQDLASALGRQLADSATAERIANGVIDAVPALADLLDDEAVNDFARRQLSTLAADTRLPALIGGGLRLLTENGRHQPLIDAALDWGYRMLGEHEHAIRKQIRSQTFWLWRVISLDSRASDALLGAIEKTLRDIARDPDHEARRRIADAIQSIADSVQSSPEARARVEAFLSDMLASPVVEAYVAEAWRDAKQTVRNAADAPDSRIRAALTNGIQSFGAALLEDAAIQEALNRRLRGFVTEIASRHGRDIGALISQTIRGWEPRTVIEKLEQSVGPDLQYIRINGTLIGGLIGLAIHQISVLIAAS